MARKVNSRRNFLKFAGVSAALLAAGGMPGLANEPKQPNFLFILADDCTYLDIGCYGGQAKTPNIDKLATDGLRFTQCFQAAPMCSPTRHCLYTGQYPVKTGAYPNHTYAKDGTVSVAHYLKDLGYRVALAGKTHISPRECFPFEYSGLDYDVLDKRFGDAAKGGKPFCQFVCSKEPHSPWNKGDASQYDPAKLKLPGNWVDTPVIRENYSRYLAEITYLDGQVGKCLELLDKHKLADNTLVIFASEQGSGFPFAKWTCYDMGLQSALIARWPGKVRANAVTDAMVEYVDVTPTFVDAAGGAPAEIFDGKSFLNLLLNKAKEHKKYVFGLQTTRGINNGSDYFGIRSVRSRDFKYILNLTPEMTFKNACSNQQYFQSWIEKGKTDPVAAEKARRYQHRPAEELYKVSDDLYEWTNLIDDPQYAAVKKELKTQLQNWMKSQGDKGQQTELEALRRQARNRNKSVGQGKKKQKKIKAKK